MLIKALQKLHKTLKNAVDEQFPPFIAPTVDGQLWQADNASEYCPRCGVSTGVGAVTKKGCWNCANKKLPWDSIIRLSSYSNPVNDWIKQMKFKRQWRWGKWFGKSLAKQIELKQDDNLRHKNTIVCPVPMHWLRRQRRGYNQAEIIARTLTKMRGWQCKELLYRTRYTKPQISIPPSQRPRNVSKAFAIKKHIRFFKLDLTQKTIVLVDDVKTSGATLKQCARVLRRAGVNNIKIAVVAVADPAQIRK